MTDHNDQMNAEIREAHRQLQAEPSGIETRIVLPVVDVLHVEEVMRRQRENFDRDGVLSPGVAIGGFGPDKAVGVTEDGGLVQERTGTVIYDPPESA